MLEIKRIDSGILRHARRLVEVSVSLHAADDLVVINPRIDQFLVAPNPAVERRGHAAQSSIKQSAVEPCSGLAEIMLDIQQALTTLASINDRVYWVLLPAFNAL